MIQNAFNKEVPFPLPAPRRPTIPTPEDFQEDTDIMYDADGDILFSAGQDLLEELERRPTLPQDSLLGAEHGELANEHNSTLLHAVNELHRMGMVLLNAHSLINYL